jgi:hypothetical protein
MAATIDSQTSAQNKITGRLMTATEKAIIAMKNIANLSACLSSCLISSSYDTFTPLPHVRGLLAMNPIGSKRVLRGVALPKAAVTMDEPAAIRELLSSECAEPISLVDRVAVGAHP